MTDPIKEIMDNLLVGMGHPDLEFQWKEPAKLLPRRAFYEALSRNLRARREALDFSQRELARVANIDASVICLVESGLREPSTRLLCSIAPMLNVSSGELLREAAAECRES